MAFAGLALALLTIASDLSAQTPAAPAATPVPECAPGKLSDYEKLGPQGCRIGDIRFTEFSRSKTSTGLLSRAISVTPGTAIDSTDPALLLEGPWLGKVQASTVLISYKVSALPPARPFIAASLQMQFGQIDGTGEATIAATARPASGSDVGVLKLQLKLGANVAKKDNDEADLATPATELRVMESVSVTSGKNGSARVNGFMTVFQLQGVKSGTK